MNEAQADQTQLGQEHSEATTTPEDGQVLLNRLLNLAPRLTDKTAQALTEEGWESFFTFRPFKPSGSADSDDIRLALAAIERNISVVSGDWELGTAKEENDKQERIFHLLKKKTQQRIDAEQEKNS